MPTKTKSPSQRQRQPEARQENLAGIVYTRVSDKSQQLNGTGGASQDTRCKLELERCGIPYDRSFFDTFSGGGDFMKRPAMRALLEYIDANPFKNFVVIFDDLSRFARDAQFHIALRQAFRSRNVTLKCLNYSFDDSPEGEFAELIMAGNNELHRKQNRRQVLQKMKARLDSGYWPFKPKAGYDHRRIPGHGLLGHPNELGKDVIAPALCEFAAGTITRKIDIVHRIQATGAWKGRRAHKCITDVTAILQDPYYCGDIEYTPWGVPRREGNHEPLIKRETYDLIQERLSGNSVYNRERRDASNEFCMRGLIICGLCGGHLTGGTSKGRSKRYRYYYCQNRACSLFYKSLPAGQIEEDFLEVLRKNALREDVEPLIVSMFDKIWKQETASFEFNAHAITEKQRALDKEISEYVILARKASGDAVRVMYEQKLEELAQQVALLKRTPISAREDGIPYRTALTRSIAMLKKPDITWDSLLLEEKRELFFVLFNDKLIYSKNEGYRTAETLCNTRLFEEVCTPSPATVDHAGLEPATSSMPWMRSTR